MMKKSIRLSNFLISLLFLFSIHSRLYACWSPGPGDIYYQYHFFQYETHSHSSNHALGSIDPEIANLKEWMNYFNHIPDFDDIKQIISNPAFYLWNNNGTPKELDILINIRKYINNKPADLDKEYLNNTLILYLKKNKNTEFINYLIKVSERNWEYGDEEKREKAETLINDLSNMYLKSESSFYKIRYAYQMVYTARWWISNELAINIYDQYVKPIDTNSIVKYWALSEVAGAYYYKGRSSLGSRWNPSINPDSIIAGENDIAVANYLFSQVYDKCPSRRSAALLSLKIKSDEDWNRVIKLCKNDKDKVNLVVMRATHPNSNLLEEMKSVYDIDPKSEHLENLMKKEFFYIEHKLLTKNFENNIFTSRDKVTIKKKEILDIIDELLVLTEKCINSQLITNSEFWMLANGYLKILSGNVGGAHTILNQIKKKKPNSDVVDQIDIFNLLIDIITVDQIDNQIEDELFLKAREIDNVFLSELLIKVFGSLYEKQGSSTKAFLCNNSHLDLGYSDDLQTTSRFKNKDYTAFSSLVNDHNAELIEKILKFIDKKDKTEFEKFLMNSTLNKWVSWNVTKPFLKDDMLSLLGTIALRDHRLDDAIRYWEQMSDKSSLGLTQNPFEVNLLDSVCDCNFCNCEIYEYNKEENTYVSLYIGPKKKYNKFDIAKELRSLLNSLNISSWNFWTTIQPEIYYKLGNYYLNTTYFGHSWRMSSNNRSGWFNAEYLEYHKGSNLDLKTPLDYYEKCIKSSKGNNNELAAECTFMAAKCEQFQYISDPSIQKTKKGRWGNDLVFPNYDVYGKYFTILKNDFSETEYYDQAIKECKYFNYFVSRDEN